MDCPPWKDDFIFQSTPSVWRETQGKPIAVNNLIISIHSLRVEGDGSVWYNADRRRSISIHSLRVEGDPNRSGEERPETISIHSLRVEGDSKIAQLSA